MSNDIKTWPATKTIVPVSVKEFKKRQPALLGAIREVVREELAAREESPVFDHPQDMLLGGSEDWHPRFKVTPAFGDGRFLLTIQLGASYGLSFHCDAHDLCELAEAASKPSRESAEPSSSCGSTPPSLSRSEIHESYDCATCGTTATQSRNHREAAAPHSRR